MGEGWDGGEALLMLILLGTIKLGVIQPPVHPGTGRLQFYSPGADLQLQTPFSGLFQRELDIGIPLEKSRR